MGKWAEKEFGNLYDVPSRNGLSKPSRMRGTGFKMINMGELFSNDRIYDIDMELVPLTDIEKEKARVDTGDLLFARQSLVASGAGKCSIVMETSELTVFESHIIRVRLDKKIADPMFYYYYFKSPVSPMQTIIQHCVQAGIKASDLEKLNVSVPTVEEQRKIGKFLATFDEKIETNQKVNDNLEKQAAAYFYHQFIVNADPSWKEGTIGDLGTVIGGSTPSKSKPEYYTDNGIAWITPKDLSVDKSKFISHGADDITELGLKNSSASIMPEGTVLFSSRAPIGYIAIADGEVTTNQGFKSVVPNSNVGTAFVYYFLKNALPTIENMASGSTFKEISGSAMRTVPAKIPDDGRLQDFSDFCNPLFQQQRTLEAENRTLAALRDSLLPKLMSGELDVSELDL
ncbi:MAG: restriction endonuclease subunit S [Lachnospiraceae bacterium]|nr:restriction endonuclease subunit S [Lachnospiraceae bacterium]